MKKSKHTTDANVTAEAAATAGTKEKSTKRKSSGFGAVFGSVLLFLLTLVFGLLLLCSMTVHSLLAKNSLSRAIATADLSQAAWTDDGKTQTLGQWVYDWYLWDAPNLSPAYAEAAMAQPEINAYLCNYLDELGAYLLWNSDTLPALSVDDVADLLQTDLSKTLAKETGNTFAEADRKSLEWTMGDDVDSWNSTLDSIIGHGFGRFFARVFCTLSGEIILGVLTFGTFLLWLILAIRKKWHKGRMLTGFGFAIGLPSLLLLLSGSMLLLLVCVMDVLSGLSFAAEGLPILLAPMLQETGIFAGAGVVISAIGIGICRSKKKKSGKSKKGKMSVATEISPVSPSEERFCPHCGAKQDTDSNFCGACGKSLE